MNLQDSITNLKNSNKKKHIVNYQIYMRELDFAEAVMLPLQNHSGEN